MRFDWSCDVLICVAIVCNYVRRIACVQEDISADKCSILQPCTVRPSDQIEAHLTILQIKAHLTILQINAHLTILQINAHLLILQINAHLTILRIRTYLISGFPD